MSEAILESQAKKNTKFATTTAARTVAKDPSTSVPDFSKLVGKLTGGRIKLSKAGLALVETDAALKNGRLLWLLPPKMAKH